MPTTEQGRARGHAPVVPRPDAGLTSQASQLAADVEQRREAQGQSSANRGAAHTAIVVPGQAGEVPGVCPGDARDLERPAPVGAAIGEGLEQGVLDSRAESLAFAELIMMVRAAVHDGGEAVADAHLRRVLRGPPGEPVSQVGAIVLTKLREDSTTDYADDGAWPGQVAQVVAEPNVLRRDPDGR